MKFLTLLSKELREIRPFVFGFSILFLVFGFVMLMLALNPQSLDHRFYNFHNSVTGGFSSNGDDEISIWNIFFSPIIMPVGIWLWLLSIAAGVAVGIRQYWVPFFTKEWGFLLHRSTSRGKILTAKIIAAIIGFIPFIALWSIFCLYGRNSSSFTIPPSLRVFMCGNLFIGFGFLVYLAVSLSGISRTKWYTTKMIGVPFVIWMLVILFCQFKLTLAMWTILAGSIILIIQIAGEFLGREFK